MKKNLNFEFKPGKLFIILVLVFCFLVGANTRYTQFRRVSNLPSDTSPASFVKSVSVTVNFLNVEAAILYDAIFQATADDLDRNINFVFNTGNGEKIYARRSLHVKEKAKGKVTFAITPNHEFTSVSVRYNEIVLKTVQAL